MPLITDPYPNFVNGETADADQVDARFLQLYSLLNGALDADNLTDAIATFLGLSQTGEVRRGQSIIPGEESRTNTAYGLMTTPDQVQNVVIPAAGLLIVSFKAHIKESVGGAMRAALFLGSDQLRVHSGGAGSSSPVVQEASLGGTANRYGYLGTCGYGLECQSSTGSDMGADVTTGMALGNLSSQVYNICQIKRAAGPVTVSVQTKSTSGSVSMKQRELRVFTIGL